jgi:hypothetical protein
MLSDGGASACLVRLTSHAQKKPIHAAAKQSIAARHTSGYSTWMSTGTLPPVARTSSRYTFPV